MTTVRFYAHTHSDGLEWGSDALTFTAGNHGDYYDINDPASRDKGVVVIEMDEELRAAIRNGDLDAIRQWLRDNTDFDQDVIDNTHAIFEIDDEDVEEPEVPRPVRANPGHRYLKVGNVLLNYRIRSDKPKRLPFVGFDLNQQENGNCFKEWAKGHYTKISDRLIDKYFGEGGTTLGHMIEWLEKKRLNAKLYNINGRLIYSNHYADSDGNKTRDTNHKEFEAIVADNHFYPRIKTKTGQFSKFEISDNMGKEIKKGDAPEGGIQMRRNDKVLTADGWYVRHTKEVNRKLDISMFKKPFLNFNFRRPVKSQALRLSSDVFQPDPEDESKMIMADCYDMKKCYPNIMMKYVPPKFQVGVWTCFDLWEEYKESEIRPESQYILYKEQMPYLHKYGIRRNAVLGFVVQLLLKHNKIQHRHIWGVRHPYYSTDFAYVRRTLTDDIEAYMAESGLKGDKAFKEKCLKARMYNGCLGRTCNANTTEITGLSGDDHMLLNLPVRGLNRDKETEIEPVWQDVGDSYRLSTTGTRTFDLVNIYNTVVDYANLLVLTKVFEIEDTHGVLPDYIVTDGLFYGPKEGRELRELDRDHRWEPKRGRIPYCKKGTDKSVDLGELMAWQEECLSKIDSRSFTGRPGTGKTHRVKNNIGGITFDYSATVANSCASNMEHGTVKAKTLFSLFNMFDPEGWRDAFRTLKGKTLWVDEFSMIPRKEWGFIAAAAMFYKTRLIITGDDEQLGPPRSGEGKIDMNHRVTRALFGNREVMSVDHRNMENLQDARDMVLREDTDTLVYEFSNMLSEDWIDEDRHLAWTKVAVDLINSAIMRRRNLSWKCVKNTKGHWEAEVSPSTLVLAKKMNRSKTNNVVKGVIYRIESADEKGYLLRAVDKEDTEIRVSKTVMASHFRVGFCITTHKAQGLTLRRFVIHQVIRMLTQHDVSLFYTALTRGIDLDDIKLVSIPETQYGDGKIDYQWTRTKDDDVQDRYDKESKMLRVSTINRV